VIISAVRTVIFFIMNLIEYRTIIRNIESNWFCQSQKSPLVSSKYPILFNPNPTRWGHFWPQMHFILHWFWATLN